MSSHASEGGQQPAAPAGEPLAAGGTVAVPAEAATAAAESDEAAPVHTGLAGAGTVGMTSGAGEGAEANPGACTPATGAACLDLTSPDLAAADLAGADGGAMTIVLDPEPEPGGYGPHAGRYEDDQPAEPVSKLAILALITGLLPLVPLAIIFGVSALVGIHRSGRRGRGMAIAALLAATAWLIVGGAVGTIGALTHGFKKPVTIKYHEAAVFKLREGDCIDNQSGAVVSCSTTHGAEVFATFQLPASAWPGTAAVAAQASSGCGSRLNGYLNPQLAVSLTQFYVYPNQAAWTEGTRTVICEVHATSGELTGSVRGAT